jgi:hypothetical protein
VVEAWERSGMSRSEYADRHGLSYGTLYYCIHPSNPIFCGMMRSANFV